MRNLLRFEFRKLLTMKSFWICTAISLFLAFLTFAVIKASLSLIGDAATQMGELGDTVVIPDVVNSVTVQNVMLSAIDGSSLILLMSIFTIIFVCDDYGKQKTVKNVYAHGFSRTQVFFAKSIVVLAACAAAFLIVYLLVFAFAAVMFPFGEEAFAFQSIPTQFLAFMANIAFTLFLSFAFKNIALSIVTFLFGPSIVDMILTVIDAVNGNTGLIKSRSFLFSNFLGLTQSLPVLDANIWIIIVGSIVYIALFGALGWLTNRKHSL